MAFQDRRLIHFFSVILKQNFVLDSYDQSNITTEIYRIIIKFLQRNKSRYRIVYLFDVQQIIDQSIEDRGLPT